jgi:hypothetical protein
MSQGNWWRLWKTLGQETIEPNDAAKRRKNKRNRNGRFACTYWLACISEPMGYSDPSISHYLCKLNPGLRIGHPYGI